MEFHLHKFDECCSTGAWLIEQHDITFSYN
jgi:hypothetical protein